MSKDEQEWIRMELEKKSKHNLDRPQGSQISFADKVCRPPGKPCGPKGLETPNAPKVRADFYVFPAP